MKPRRPFPLRSLLAFAHDVVASAMAWLAAFWLRFNLDIPSDYLATAVVALPPILVANSLLLWRIGLYQGILRFASLPDLQKILLAVGLATAISAALTLVLAPTPAVPRDFDDGHRRILSRRG